MLSICISHIEGEHKYSDISMDLHYTTRLSRTMTQLYFYLSLEFLSTSKRVIVNCINVAQQVSVNAKAGIKVICYPFVSPSPYKKQLIKYLFFISLYHYYKESVVQAGIRTHDLMTMSSMLYP